MLHKFRSKSKSEVQVRSEALATIESAITRMSIALETASKSESKDPALQRRHWMLKRALNRIEFEVLVALGGCDEDLELLEAENDQMAKVIRLRTHFEQ